MPFEYLEVTAEIGIRAWGQNLSEAFAEAACALFDLMVDIAAVRARQSISIELIAESSETLLVDWLNRLLLERDRTGYVFSVFHVTITPQINGLSLVGQASGEPLDRERHKVRIDVKAVTYNALHVLHQSQRAQVECILDI